MMQQVKEYNISKHFHELNQKQLQFLKTVKTNNSSTIENKISNFNKL